MDYETGKILWMEVGDYRDVGRKSTLLEQLVVVRGIDYLTKVANVQVLEVVTDGSKTLIKIFGKIKCQMVE
jgi:hypothetical protein